jgi:Tfp pilus assembly protein PilO
MSPSHIVPQGKTAFHSRLITIASGGAAVAYALLVFVPQQHGLVCQQRKIREQETQIARSLTLVQPIRALEDQLAETERFTSGWRAKAPTSHNAAPVFADIVRHAEEADARVLSFAPQAEQPCETLGRIPVALQAEGSYQSLHQLLERLEEMRGLVWIDEVHLQPQGQGDGRLSCTLKLTIFANRAEISG